MPTRPISESTRNFAQHVNGSSSNPGGKGDVRNRAIATAYAPPPTQWEPSTTRSREPTNNLEINPRFWLPLKVPALTTHFYRFEQF